MLGRSEKYLKKCDEVIKSVEKILGAPEKRTIAKIENLIEEWKTNRKKIDKLREKVAKKKTEELEFEKIGDRFVKSEYGMKLRHPLSGAKLAKELALPDEVVLIIHAHSFEGEGLKRSPEAIIVNHCDFIDFDIKKSLV